MEQHSIQAIFRALGEAEVRYLVVGGLAVLAHGYLRTTQDIDIVLDLEESNVRRAVRAFEELGYQPAIPVALDDFAITARRRSWVEEKDARVFQLFSDQHRSARVDLFLEEPFDFESAYRRARREEVAEGVEVAFVGLEELIAMKLEAARPQDLLDVERLQALHKSES
jgi:hypothetical protein